MSRWSRFCPYELELAEDKLKELSNVSVTSHRIPIGNSQHLYTSMCGDPSNPPLILLHGFCGAGMIFYKILEELTRNYYVYIIDLLGMGRSSRPGYSATTVSGAETFFVESIESFRIALGLDKFILVGHSFGGYISGCYSLKYPQWVQYLLFLSPVGMSEQPPGFDYLMYLEEKNWKYRWVMKFVSFFWVRNVTPISLMRKAGPMSGKLLELFSLKKFCSIPREETSYLESYLEQINLMSGSGELALIYILHPGGYAKNPLCKRLHSLKIPMAFFYGDRDWMNKKGAEQLAESNDNIHLKIISNSDHHLYWDNPRELSEKMMSILKEFDNLTL